MQIDFPSEFQNWTAVAPISLLRGTNRVVNQFPAPINRKVPPGNADLAKMLKELSPQ